MKYATPNAFRTALEERLKNLARESGLSVARLRKTVAFEVLLRRLLHIAPEQWVLKGALALEFRIGTRTRTTRDVDLAGWDKPDDVTAVLLSAQSEDQEDFFSLRVDRIDREPGWDAIRYRIVVELAGREFETIGVDVGLSDPQLWPPESSSSPGLLEFAGIPRMKIPVQAAEQQVAEKLHAYTRVYSDARRSSRTKDLIDLCLIARNESLNSDRLNQAIAVIFERRRTQEPPVRFAEPPEWWERQ
ncbi:MAG TPA: nucleotidyl transferase AbiEii/AbiGii toxin family protein [Gemmatimonadota bacterium]|nr:nucleotidyl transferase AbiEii/AbiGii toxin family protein [Gemmatimonadota bacterium]